MTFVKSTYELLIDGENFTFDLVVYNPNRFTPFVLLDVVVFENVEKN